MKTHARINLILLFLYTISGFEISLIHINSEFDIRNGALNSSVIAECIVHNYDGFIETIFFQIGDREFPLKALNQNGTYSAVLEKVPISYYDKKWLSCLIEEDGYPITSDTCFPMEIKYLPTTMRLEFINGLQYDDIWMVNELDHFIIQCIPNGNPKPKVQISIDEKKTRRSRIKALRSKDDVQNVYCATITGTVFLEKRLQFAVNYLDEPSVTVVRLNNQLGFHCECKGYPKPTIKWTGQPKEVKQMSIRHSKKRKLGFWDYPMISEESLLIMGNGTEGGFYSKRSILICTAKNLANSKSVIIHKKKHLKIQGKKNLDLLSADSYVAGAKYQSQFKKCPGDVCQLNNTKGFIIRCRNNLLSNEADSKSLTITFDGKKLPKLESAFEGEIMSVLMLSAQHEFNKKRKDKKGKSIHKVSCSDGENDLETMRIIPNYIRIPLIGLLHNFTYRNIKRPARITRRVGKDTKLTCYSDAIPEASYYWSYDNKIISQTNKLELTNITMKESGLYRCSAANSFGTKTNSIRIRIH